MPGSPRWPPPVCPGDTIGVVAPAGPVSPADLQGGVSRLRRLGYRVRLAANIASRTGFFAGNDEERAAALTGLWHDPEVRAIICARGGHGSMRLLPLLDVAAMAANPKFFCGYSDITALHQALGQAGLVTFHGDMAALPDSLSSFNAASLRRALQGAAAGPVPPRPAPDPHLAVTPGTASGRLTGGNLTVLSALEGTPWALTSAGRVVLLEDVGETPERVDRMLSHLLLAGKLHDAAGVVFGHSPTCEQAAAGPGLAEVLADRLGRLGIPVCYGLPLGHSRHRATVPLGAPAQLDAGAGVLTVLGLD